MMSPSKPPSNQYDLLHQLPIPVLSVSMNELKKSNADFKPRVAKFLRRCDNELASATKENFRKIKPYPKVPVARSRMSSPERQVAVLGLYASGSSAIARVLENLGIYMGEDLCNDFCEPIDLKKKLRSWWSEPELVTACDSNTRMIELRKWLNVNREKAKLHWGYCGVGAKHPLLSLCAKELGEAWGSDTKFIWSRRTLEESITSLIRLGWFPGKETRVQKTLWRDIIRFLKDRSHLAIDHDQLLANPVENVERIADFLELSPTLFQLNSAVQSVLNPNPTIEF